MCFIKSEYLILWAVVFALARKENNQRATTIFLLRIRRQLNLQQIQVIYEPIQIDYCALQFVLFSISRPFCFMGHGFREIYFIRIRFVLPSPINFTFNNLAWFFSVLLIPCYFSPVSLWTFFISDLEVALLLWEIMNGEQYPLVEIHMLTFSESRLCQNGIPWFFLWKMDLYESFQLEMRHCWDVQLFTEILNQKSRGHEKSKLTKKQSTPINHI